MYILIDVIDVQFIRSVFVQIRNIKNVAALRIQSKIVLAKKLLWINNKQSITKTLNNIILSMQISEYTCIVGKQCTAVWCEQNNMSLKSSCAVDVYLIVI